MMFIKQKTEKDASVYSYEDNYSPEMGYSSTEKEPVLAYDYVEDVQESVEDIGGLVLTPASVGNNSVFKVSIYASVSGGLAFLTVFTNLYSNFHNIRFELKKGYNEIAIFTNEPMDEVGLSVQGLLFNVVGGWNDNYFTLRAGISSNGRIE